tara:strand:- start:47 stop:553 length:507 start_codon:yes stop_codon:yes gene_type:complete
MSGPFKLKYKKSSFPFKSKKIDFFKSFDIGKKDSKTTTSLIADAGISEEFGKRKFKSFGAVDVSKTFDKGGKVSLTGSKVLEPGVNISALGTKYTTPKGFSIGAELSKGRFTENDPYVGKIVTKTGIKPRLNLEKRFKKGIVKINTSPDFKSGKIIASLNIGGKRNKK